MIRVLMIDDDKDMCDEMADILECDGFKVTAICDPARGMKLAKEKEYDLILLDLKMPGISGYDILRSVKKLDAKLKVIVMTGSPMNIITGSDLNKEEQSQNELLSLADEVVIKSVDIGAFLEKIKEVIRRV